MVGKSCRVCDRRLGKGQAGEWDGSKHRESSFFHKHSVSELTETLARASHSDIRSGSVFLPGLGCPKRSKDGRRKRCSVLDNVPCADLDATELLQSSCKAWRYGCPTRSGLLPSQR